MNRTATIIARPPQRTRRGNTLVLVSAILVLLVIIATAYVTRTSAERVTATAIRDSSIRDNNANIIAAQIADEIALALFARPVQTGDPQVAIGNTASSNWPRLAPGPDAMRYGTDPTDLLAPFNVLDYPYNYAPYHVVPYTNWPDPVGDASIDSMWGFGDLPGNPGFGDSRWLASSEPYRWDSDNDGTAERYSHWPHLSNLSRPGNGWRVIRDMSDIENGGLAVNLRVPIEQWRTNKPQDVNAAVPDALLLNVNTFETKWFDRLDPNIANSAWTFRIAAAIPHNFYQLADLNGNGIRHEFNQATVLGERPQDEFIRGKLRWYVGRYLADADGDGYTDSLWHLAPTPVERGIRQAVAIRIVDNSDSVNVNTATRFVLNDQNFNPNSKTIGANPADIALVGENVSPPATGVDTTWSVGYFDSRLNREPPIGFQTYPCITEVGWAPSRWDAVLDELGVFGNVNFPSQLTLARERLLYWQASGRNPMEASGGLTPFGLGEELELRMYHGQNYPWVISRLEQAVSPPGLIDAAFLRSSLGCEETSAYLDQVGNVGLMRDHRKRLTTYSGARNDIMPPWVWLHPDNDINNDGIVTQQEQIDFDLGLRRFDLRGRDDVTDFNGDGIIDNTDKRLFGQRLRDGILAALRWEDPVNPGTGQTYFGPLTPSIEDDVERAAASLAANILANRDLDDVPATLDAASGEAVVVDSDSGIGEAFIGLEPQPFIMEAFVGHFYKVYEVPPADFQGHPYGNAGHEVIFDNDGTGGPTPTPPQDLHGTIVVVQIANPFGHTIDLSDFEIEVFGQPFDMVAMPQSLLPPTTPEAPNTVVFYAVSDDLVGISPENRLLQFLRLTDADHTGPTGAVHINRVKVGSWSTDRDYYDGSSADAVRLLRRDPVTLERIVIDRIDDPIDREFGDAVNELQDDVPSEFNDRKPDPLNSYDVPPLIMAPYDPGIDLGPDSIGATHWIQWTRFTRAWGVDVDYSGIYDADERNPRYVFADGVIVEPAASTAPPDSTYTPKTGVVTSDPTPKGNFVSLGIALNPNAGWFTRDYMPMQDPNTALPVSRAPTFFAFNGGVVNGYPDKGWYGQEGEIDDDSDGVEGVDDAADPAVHRTVRDYPMQMLLKNRDYEQVGEILNTFIWGHQLSVNLLDSDGDGVFSELGPSPNYADTIRTFSELLADETLSGDELTTALPVNGREGIRVGRLDPFFEDSVIVADDSVPDLPAAVRVLDALVCDGPGINGTIGVDEFYNANGYLGLLTPGMINLNTAPIEVIRALPHIYKLVHETNSASNNPRTSIARAIKQYLDRLPSSNALQVISSAGAPDYSDRPDDVRTDRGLASPGEVLLMTREAPNDLLDPDYDDAIEAWGWRADMGAGNAQFVPFDDGFGLPASARISTDRHDPEDAAGIRQPDLVAGDAEEANALFAGISNMVTTRSDVFTVYFKIRSFRQNPTTKVWDALDPEYIVDDSRYVMLVDRSQVNSPSDKPRILYLEKLPN